MYLSGLLFPRFFQQILPFGFRIFGNERLLIGHEFFHPLPAIGPPVREIDDDPRPLGIFQQLQPCTQDAALVFRIVGPARRVAQGIIEKDLPRVAGAGSDIPPIGIGDSGDASCFQHTGNQTHGLVTDGSDRR